MSQFEKDTGCQVNVKTAATSDEMVSLMAKGGYDLVTASGDASLRLIMGKRVQPINTALIAGWGSLDPRIAKGRGLTSAVKSMARRISGGRTC
ncbi:ABC transporter, periplasmic spermidine putrescine-binding protein PotD [Klebsiella pneumoniae]|uniref:ABC transporter, periplasmic spermidine putrescine-binding protein PotD n=1 Tax=Klebsiella pneumoniae TaxID=573 RepID=A0A377W136_KLEPN|nr:ABC transporter, periplasmic spermidine putrescine-binding protein PotD [Klebsiella pneumoniae]